MPRIITTTTHTTPTKVLFKPPSTICGGFIDIHGTWNNGFDCPIQNLVQFFCCGTDIYRYCCPPDRYFSDTNTYIDHDYTSYEFLSSSTNALVDRNNNLHMNEQNLIKKQFEQFQRLFLPIFLLTSSILFLVGIALWFWLYKHKTFYSLEREDLSNGQCQLKPTKSHLTHPDPILKRREHTPRNAVEQQSRRISYPITEV